MKDQTPAGRVITAARSVISKWKLGQISTKALNDLASALTALDQYNVLQTWLAIPTKDRRPIPRSYRGEDADLDDDDDDDVVPVRTNRCGPPQKPLSIGWNTNALTRQDQPVDESVHNSDKF